MKRIDRYIKGHYPGNLIDALELTEEELIEINPFDNSTLIVEKTKQDFRESLKENQTLSIIVPNKFFDKPKVWRSVIPEICKAAVRHFAEHYNFDKIDVQYSELRESEHGLSIIFTCSKLDE